MDVKAEIDEFADDWGLTDFQTKDLEGFAARVRREMMEEACRAVCHDCYKGEPVVLGKVKPNSAYLPRWKHKTIECSAHRIRAAFSADAKPEEPSARAQFDSDSIVIGICTAEPAQPFLFYVSGRVSVDVLSEIEQQYAEDCLEPTTDPANVREPRGSFEEFYRVRKVQDDTPYWQFDSMSDPRVARAQFDKAAVELATWVAGELPSGRYLLVREMCNKILDATRTLGIEGATP